MCLTLSDQVVSSCLIEYRYGQSHSYMGASRVCAQGTSATVPHYGHIFVIKIRRQGQFHHTRNGYEYSVALAIYG